MGEGGEVRRHQSGMKVRSYNPLRQIPNGWEFCHPPVSFTVTPPTQSPHAIV
jgi:hypothetical protein